MIGGRFFNTPLIHPERSYTKTAASTLCPCIRLDIHRQGLPVRVRDVGPGTNHLPGRGSPAP